MSEVSEVMEELAGAGVEVEVAKPPSPEEVEFDIARFCTTPAEHLKVHAWDFSKSAPSPGNLQKAESRLVVRVGWLFHYTILSTMVSGASTEVMELEAQRLLGIAIDRIACISSFRGVERCAMKRLANTDLAVPFEVYAEIQVLANPAPEYLKQVMETWNSFKLPFTVTIVGGVDRFARV